MSANDIVLHYFDIKGLAEGIRLLFEEAGIEYKEERFTRAGNIMNKLLIFFVVDLELIFLFKYRLVWID